MGVIRIFELARELGRPSREIISILNGMGILVTSHANVIDEDTVRKVREYYIHRGVIGDSPSETPEPEEAPPVSETLPTPEPPSTEEPTVATPAAPTPPPEPPPPPVEKPSEPSPEDRSSRPRRERRPSPRPSERTEPPRRERLEEEPREESRPPYDRRFHKRAIREELRRITQRRDYVRVSEQRTETVTARSPGARLQEWTRRGPERSSREPLVPPPPPRPDRKKAKPRVEEVEEWRPKEKEKEIVLPKKRDTLELPEITEIREITIPEGLTVKDLAQRMGVKPNLVIQALIRKGHLMTLNQVLPTDLAVEVAEMFGYIAQPVPLEEALLLEEAIEDRPEDRIPRPPVVTVMGHVDHGKTTLLDTIRRTNVAEQEAGGITQRIGAYQAEVNGRKITFIDTPGHEAFTQMRARGARATDIVILVVAADDGVMPQTVEAIDHARAAGCPIVVAINKIDKPNADVERVKRQLAEVGLLVEEWGGETVAVPISAKKGEGIQELLEMVLLVADLAELKANPHLPARGIILESKLDPKRGAVASVLVQNGTLRVGDVFVAGATWGRVRAMLNDRGQRVSEAFPAMPVEVMGFEELPQAGDTFQVVHDEAKARQIASLRREKQREQMRVAQRIRLEDLSTQIQEGAIRELPLILKADTQGSMEALKGALEELTVEEVRIYIVHAGVGGVTASDVMLAAASNAIILGFNVRPDRKAREQAEQEGVEMRFYNVIYDVVEDIKNAIRGMLQPRKVERTLGIAEVRQIFRIKSVGVVAGCYVREGKVVRGERARLVRDQVVVYDGKIQSLRRFKEDVREVPQGYECGLTLANFNDIKEGDIIEVYTIEEMAAEEPFASRAAS